MVHPLQQINFCVDTRERDPQLAQQLAGITLAVPLIPKHNNIIVLRPAYLESQSIYVTKSIIIVLHSSVTAFVRSH